MNTEIDVHAYVRDLERHLQLTLFGGRIADPEGAVLLVRGALAEGDPERAAALADATGQLAAAKPAHPDMATAADHARGLTGQDAAALEQAAGRYRGARARATALEDAGRVRVGQGDEDHAEALLRQAYAIYDELGSTEGKARVRALLRAVGTRLCHWTHQNRPAFGWGSLTDTEKTIADFVAEGLSNRQVAGRVFLSPHTVAFHLRHVFWKLGVTSRVQLARIAAEQAALTAATDSLFSRPPSALNRCPATRRW
jgi:DNA-binding CsgD family transcriptional regulator